MRYTAKTCVHPYYMQWAGKCEGCRKPPLSPNLPDPHNPRRASDRVDPECPRSRTNNVRHSKNSKRSGGSENRPSGKERTCAENWRPSERRKKRLRRSRKPQMVPCVERAGPARLLALKRGPEDLITGHGTLPTRAVVV